MEEALEEMEIFLSGTFHQDIKSIDEAIEEYITDCNEEWLHNIIKIMEEFLDSAMDIDKKNEFIQENTEIYFPMLNITPLQWLKSVKEIIEKSI